MFDVFKKLAISSPDLVKPWAFGHAVSGQKIYGLKISSAGPKSQQASDNNNPLKPIILILGGIHGDHALGHELTIYLANLLIDNHDSSPRIRELINEFDIYIIPTLNPDGFKQAKEGDCYSNSQLSGRNNMANVDLDSDFKFHDYSSLEQILKLLPTKGGNIEGASDNEITTSILQPESQTIVDLAGKYGNRLHLVITLRTGHTGLTYPFDELKSANDQANPIFKWFNSLYSQSAMSDDPSLVINEAPDKRLYQYLGHKIYYGFQEEPIDSECSLMGDNSTVIAGSQFSPNYGTMNDFLYKYTNALPLNVYLDCCKYPNRTLLAEKWLQHANSIFAMLESARLGVHGRVLDAISSKPIPNAKILVKGIDSKVVRTNEAGYFWRAMPPSSQSIELMIEAEGYNRTEQRSSTAIMNIDSGRAKSSQMLIHLIPSDATLASSTIKNDNIINNEIVNMDGMQTDRAPEMSKKDAAGSRAALGELVTGVITGSTISKPEILYQDVNDHINRLNFKSMDYNMKRHHNYVQMTDYLKSLASKYKEISKLYSIGQSVKGREIWVLEMSDMPGRHQLLKPEFRYVANMHGNEVVGRELLLHLARLLLENYSTDSLVKALLDSTRIHFLFSLNPDGYEAAKEGDCESNLGRPNSNLVDLNRNFPDRFPDYAENKPMQPETIYFMRWARQHPFVLSANLHGGSIVANYPFDGNRNKVDGQYERSPDDKLFRHLSLVYSRAHANMHKGEVCRDICGDDTYSLLNEKFKDGITNGASWYVLYGGIQDWTYLNTNCFGITLELGCKKYPYARDMVTYWNENKLPLIKYILEVHRGIYGYVTDQNNRPIANATIKVKDIDHDVLTGPEGDFWRLLMPGEYLVSVHKENYRAAHRRVTVGPIGSPAKKLTFTLVSGPKVLSDDPIQDMLAENDGPGTEGSITFSHHHRISNQLLNHHHHANYSSTDEDPKLEKTTTRLADGGEQVAPQAASVLHSARLRQSSFGDKFIAFILFLMIAVPCLIGLAHLVAKLDRYRRNRTGFSRLRGDDDEIDEGPELGEGFDEPAIGRRAIRTKGRSQVLAGSSLRDSQALGEDSEEDELYSAQDWAHK